MAFICILGTLYTTPVFMDLTCVVDLLYIVDMDHWGWFWDAKQEMYVATRVWRACSMSQRNVCLACFFVQWAPLGPGLSPTGFLLSCGPTSREHMVVPSLWNIRQWWDAALWGINVAAKNSVKCSVNSWFSYVNVYWAKTCKHVRFFSCLFVKIVSLGLCLYADCARRPNTENQWIPLCNLFI